MRSPYVSRGLPQSAVGRCRVAVDYGAGAMRRCTLDLPETPGWRERRSPRSFAPCQSTDHAGTALSSPAAGAALPIETQGLCKRYGTSSALEQLSLRVAAGEVYGYLGPNGSGKTTTIRLLLVCTARALGAPRCFRLDARRDPVAAHRRSGACGALQGFASVRTALIRWPAPIQQSGSVTSTVPGGRPSVDALKHARKDSRART
jgi:hypothetical protein